MGSRRESEIGWNKVPPLTNGVHKGEFDAFDFHQTPMNEINFEGQQATPREERENLNLNTQVRSYNPDAVGRHLLYETALLDTQSFEILDIDEVDALKKEQERLDSRIEATQRKLKLESKVRDAAQNLQRLYSTNKRPDTPQSPESPKRHRNSLLGGRRKPSIDTTDTGQRADHELAASVKMVDELHVQITDLISRREDVERKLLRHTAAVLAEEANRLAESGVPGATNGHHWDDDDNYQVGAAYSDFDGIRDILHGRPVPKGISTQEQEEQLSQIQEKLEDLNYQLRNIISEAAQSLGEAPVEEAPLDQSEDSTVRIESRFERLESNLNTLSSQQQDVRTTEVRLQEAERRLRGNIEAIEEHLEGVNGQLHSALLQASENTDMPELEEPPRAGEHGYQDHLQYLEEGVLTIEQLLQQPGQTRDLEEARARAEDLSKKHGEYETTVTGLWNVLQSDSSNSPKPDQEDNEKPLPKEPFSLQAFNDRVQQVFQRSQAAREQQNILRRQIQQQRDLGGKSDMEKEAQISGLQDKHDQLAREHGTVQQEFASLMQRHEQTQGEATESRAELTRVMDEVEEMKRSIQTKQQAHDEVAQKAVGLQSHVQNLERQISQHGETQQHSQELEAEIVRLTMELTMAKAELDGAYGTRAERAGAQAAEVESLNERNKDMLGELTALRAEVDTLRVSSKSSEHTAQLEQELQEMTNEFQEMTKESIALERERAQLDSLIDSLRDRCDELESQVADERLHLAGIQKADGLAEARHMHILKQEFKKMMREQKVEGVKQLRVSCVLIGNVSM